MQDDALFFFRRQFLLLTLYRFGKIFLKTPRPVSILCYHSFEEGSNRYAISYQKFREQIEAIQSVADIIPLSEAVATLSGKRRRRASVAITIDDGYADIMPLAEYTKKQKIPITLFALSDPDHVDRSGLAHGGTLLKYSDLRYLATLGWTIGCHGATHKNLTKLTKDDLKKEIHLAKNQLEEKVGVSIDYFAYPNGYFSNRVIEAVKDAGFNAGFSILPGTVSRGSNRWVLPRTVINSDDSLATNPQLYLFGPGMVGGVIDRFGPWTR